MQKKPKLKQIIAILMIILLVAMYVITLCLAIFSSKQTGKMFQASLFLTIALPILLWIYIFLYGIYSRRHTIADMNLFQSMKDSSPHELNSEHTDEPSSIDSTKKNLS